MFFTHYEGESRDGSNCRMTGKKYFRAFRPEGSVTEITLRDGSRPPIQYASRFKQFDYGAKMHALGKSLPKRKVQCEI